jgi:adenylylsulfate kinase-like enzyme
MTIHVSPGFVIWFTGLPSSGKSTLANLLQQQLAERQIPTQLLDSDTLRQQLTPQPTYTRPNGTGSMIPSRIWQSFWPETG